MSLLDTLLDGSLMPHGQCLLWRPDLLLLHVGGDLMTLVAYFTIPPAMLVFRKKRKDLKFDWLLILFAAFIFLCGITHLMGLINIWQGYYFIEGLTKFMTGFVSVVTAIAVWYLLPIIMKVPTLGALITNSEVLKQSEQEITDARETLMELEQKIADRLLMLRDKDL